MFWQVTSLEIAGFLTRGSFPFDPGPSLYVVRLAGSAFFILGFAASSVYADMGRSSMCASSRKRSFSNARSITRTSSKSISSPVPEAAAGAFAVGMGSALTALSPPDQARAIRDLRLAGTA